MHELDPQRQCGPHTVELPHLQCSRALYSAWIIPQCHSGLPRSRKVRLHTCLMRCCWSASQFFVQISQVQSPVTTLYTLQRSADLFRTGLTHRSPLVHTPPPLFSALRSAQRGPCSITQ